MATYNCETKLFCTTQSRLKTSLDDDIWYLAVPIEIWVKHSLEEQFRYLAFTTSTMAPSRVARLGWFPSQAKLPLYGFWPRQIKQEIKSCSDLNLNFDLFCLSWLALHCHEGNIHILIQPVSPQAGKTKIRIFASVEHCSDKI